MASTVVRCLMMCSGTMGSATRVSTHMATDSRTSAAPTMPAVCQEPQANELSTNEIQMSSTLTPEVIRVAPR
ncbi:hypothetical protein ACWC0A_35480 [Streptomyces scopuliridis]